MCGTADIHLPVTNTTPQHWYTMTDNTQPNNESTTHTTADDSEFSYPPNDGHLCDQSINYDELSITLPLDREDNGGRTLTGTCDVCGRDITITICIDVEMLKVTDVESGEIIHCY